MIPLLLGLGNALVTVLAFAKLRWLSATILILIQVPWTIWDIANGLPGFLVLVPLGFVPMGMMLWERRKARRPVDWSGVKLEINVESENAMRQFRELALEAAKLGEHPGEPRLVPHLDALEEHKEHLRTFDGED